MIKLEEFKNIPFLDHSQISATRGIPTLTFYDNEEWHCWLPTNQGLLKYIGYPAEGTYLSKIKASEDDIYFEFFNFLSQRALQKNIIKPVHGISDDIMNICASLSKLDLLFELSKNKSTEVSRMVVTEIEYLINVCRSLFDLLQEIIYELWETVIFFDKNRQKKKLQKTFSKMIIINEEIVTKETLVSKYNIPDFFADYYLKYSSFFSILRKYRNNIIHHGSSLDYFLVTEKGFGFRENTKPFWLFDIKKDTLNQINGLFSLRVPVAYMVKTTLNACEDFSKVIQKFILFDNEIAPNFKLFFRMYHSSQLLKLDTIIENSLWYDE